MKIFCSLIFCAALFTLPAMAQGLPPFVLEKGVFYSVEAGASRGLFRLSSGIRLVNEGILQSFDLDLGALPPNFVAGASYGIAFGPRSGSFHIGPRVGLGLARFGTSYMLETSLRVSFSTNLGLFPALRFQAAAGWCTFPIVQNAGPPSFCAALGVAWSKY